MYSESFFCISARRSQALPLPTGVLQRQETEVTHKLQYAFTDSSNNPIVSEVSAP